MQSDLFSSKTTPTFEQPAFLTTSLREHQRVGVGWMIHRESNAFRGCRGGLLLDDVGLGKTLQLLTTIYEQKHSKRVVGPTLVVSDRSIMDVWKNELTTHFASETPLSTYTYHGKKNRDAFHQSTEEGWLGQYDLIFTTYDTMRIERNKHYDDKIIVAREGDVLRCHSPFVEGSLFLRAFSRIILDEAHKIRNRNAGYYQSVIHLKDEFRIEGVNHHTIHWGISARPVLNRLDDLFPLFQFLGMNPFSDSRYGYSRWRNDIVRPMEYTSRNGMKTLHEYMVPIALRRTKEILNLPEVHKAEEEITLPDREFEFYSYLYQYVRQRTERLLQRVEEIRNSGGARDSEDRRINMATASVNVMLTRLRQCCCAPALVLKSMRRLESLLGKPDVLRECVDRIRHIIEHPDELEECAICMDAEANYMAIPCRHLCCQRCWDKVKAENPRCPFCRGTVTAYRKVSQTTVENLTEEIEGGPIWDEMEHVSSKVDFLIAHLKEHIWDEKAVVVTDFRTFLDVIQKALSRDEILKDVKVARIDGKVTGANRFDVVQAFQSQDPDSPRILLMTYKCGGEGITLTSASRLYEMNPWWNEAQMYQAEGRLHRLGQEKRVMVHQLRIAGTIEDKIYEMVDRKGFISNATMQQHQKAPEKMPWANRVRLMMGINELEPARTSKRRKLGTNGQWETSESLW